jgi:hypothetical protein
VNPADLLILQTILTDLPAAIVAIQRIVELFGLDSAMVLRVAKGELPAIEPAGPDVGAEYAAAKVAAEAGKPSP